MTIRDSFFTAITGLKTNKTRAMLTMLGIVIGVASIILMMSIGKGAESLILKEIGGLGAETVILRPGSSPKGFSDFGSTLFADSLKMKDVEALRRKSNAPYITEVVPMVIVPGNVTYERNIYSPTIIGGSATFFSRTFNVNVKEGILFDETDIQQNATVAVIGSKVASELFGTGNPLGEYITIKNKKIRVIGLFPQKGQAGIFNFDELIIVPYTTAQIYLTGIDHFHEIIIKSESTATVAKTVKDVEATIRESHNISDPKDDDFFVLTQQGVVDQIQTIIGALTAFLSSVVAIALVVGGIGVMNIMLVSVTERTREIGLRKSIGATKKDILTQFLFEAVILTSIGGIIGIIFGASLSLLASFVLTTFVKLQWTFTFPVFAAFLGLTVSAGVGLLFGIYPARKASIKSPIDALRYE